MTAPREPAQQNEVVEGELSAAATHLADEADEGGHVCWWEAPTVHATRSHRSAAVLAQQEHLLVDAIDAETSAVHETDRLQHVRKERVVPDRRAAQEVPGRCPTGESSGARVTSARPSWWVGWIDWCRKWSR